MAKDASEERRDEDSTVAGYDKDGKVKIFRTSELRNGKLPEGYSDAPPEGTHPNDPNREEKLAARKAREAEEERAAAEQAAKEQQANRGQRM